VNIVNIEDLRLLARKRLPKAIFEFIDGGALDEVTLRANRADFERVRLVPRTFTDVSQCSLATTVLGQPVQLPLIMAPVGLLGMVRRQAEVIAARTAASAGMPFCLSMMAAGSVEEVCASASAPPWFQLYLLKERAMNRVLLQRARAAGCKVLVLTADTKTQGPRERDIRNGFTVPPRITLRSAFDAVRCWRWVHDVALGPTVTFANLKDLTQGSSDVFTITQFIADKYDLAFDWEALEWCKSEWQGPVAVKGILSPVDAKLAVQHGADGIIVSNHGGRQMDGALSSIAALPAIVDAVGASADVILDGGVRRGVDVVKALALGARACMAGRPFVYSLAALGEDGMQRAIAIFKAEMEKALMLLGCNSVQALQRGYVCERG
jgi:L-lactate dehydrogenase (cytochrome)